MGQIKRAIDDEFNISYVKFGIESVYMYQIKWDKYKRTLIGSKYVF